MYKPVLYVDTYLYTYLLQYSQEKLIFNFLNFGKVAKKILFQENMFKRNFKYLDILITDFYYGIVPLF